jgi:glycerate 2-kinase
VSDSHTAHDALAILLRYGESIAPAATAYLRRLTTGSGVAVGGATDPGALAPSHPCLTTNLIIGNNAVAVDAAGIEAERRGYSHAMHAATSLESAAEDVGQHLARMALRMQSESGPDCLITGGEPTVKLAPPERRGKGGRNQQLVLASLIELLNADCGLQIADYGTGASAATPQSAIRIPQFCLLSGGTDGEDGPTDAAGALIDAEIIDRMHDLKLDPADFLRRNDAYTFFERVGGLIKTGPTHTNVCDVRVVVVDRQSPGAT